MDRRVLAIFSARCDRQAEEAVAAGIWPRKDFLELRRALHADCIDQTSVDRGLAARTIGRIVGMAAAQAWLAFRRRGAYDSIFCDGEHIGIPLALLLRLTRRRPRLVMLGHLLTTPVKRRVFRFLQPQAAIDAILVHSALQRRLAIQELGLTAEQVRLIPYQVDCAFWSTSVQPAEEALICAAGLEYRDYATLIRAADGLDVRVVLATGRRWSRHREETGGAAGMANVEVTALGYVGLRDLYARARIVVVPLREIENQAGVTSILEAMAMARPLIVTATRGQQDVVHGRLCTAAGVSDQRIGDPSVFGVDGPAATAETGLYVPPGDAAALRRAIEYLFSHPDDAAAMGAAGRRLVEQWMDLDRFVERIVAAVRGEPERRSSRAEERMNLASRKASG